MKKLRITVDGKVYEVTVELLEESAAQPTTTPSARKVVVPVVVPPTSAPAPQAGAGSVSSPLAGKVVSIDVQTGQSVQEGATLITLEAMKMNTFVAAPHGGTVGVIHVKVGDPVEEGQALLSLS